MGAGLADLALRRPWLLLGANAAALVVAVLLAAGAPSHLGIGSERLTDQPRAARAPDLVIAMRGRVPVGSGVYRVALDVITSRVRSDDDVRSVRRGPESGDGRSTSLLVDLRPADDAARQRAVERLEGEIDPGPLRIAYGGETQTLLDARDSVGADLWKLELLALPFALLALAAAFGARLAAAPLLCAATAIAGSVAGMRLLGGFGDPSLLGVVPAAALGLALGIELPHIVIARHREAASRQAGGALTRAIAAGARTGALAVVAAVAVTSGLLATPLPQADSILAGCTLAALLATASALAATPAVIVLAQERGEVPPPRLPAAVSRPSLRIARSRRGSAAAMLLAVAALAAATVPALDGATRPLDVRDLPADAQSRQAAAIAPGFSAASPRAASGEQSLFGDLPVAGAVAFATFALALLALSRSLRAIPVALAGLLPAAAATGLGVLVFQQGHLAGALGQEQQDALDTAALACAVAALGALGAHRVGAAMEALRTDRSLDARSVRRSGLVGATSLSAAILASVVLVAAAGVLTGADLYAAREFGALLAVGTLLDALLRIPLLAALARWGPTH